MPIAWRPLLCLREMYAYKPKRDSCMTFPWVNKGWALERGFLPSPFSTYTTYWMNRKYHMCNTRHGILKHAHGTARKEEA